MAVNKIVSGRRILIRKRSTAVLRSGGNDEQEIRRLLAEVVPIDWWG